MVLTTDALANLAIANLPQETIRSIAVYQSVAINLNRRPTTAFVNRMSYGKYTIL